MQNEVAKLFILGITGGTGSGTSTLGGLLEKKGFLYIDCDKVYHELLSSDKELKKKLIDRFGAQIKTPEGSIDRRLLGKIVFSDKDSLLDLNSITHGRIKERVLEIIHSAHAEKIAVGAVALIESGMRKLCTSVIGVIADNKTRTYRIMIRDALTKSEAKKRIAVQKDDEFYIKNCDYIIDNSGTIEELEKKVDEILPKIMVYGTETEA
jgi:dephospho-CoA kinase